MTGPDPIETATVLVIPGEPVPKLRARVYRNNGKVHGVTPKKSREWERDARLHLAAQLRRHPCWRGPIGIRITAVMTRPKTVKRQYPSVKPDGDNIAKLCCDALNGILWTDDAQVIDLWICKRYCQPGQSPHVEVVAWQICSAEENEGRTRHLGVASE